MTFLCLAIANKLFLVLKDSSQRELSQHAVKVSLILFFKNLYPLKIMLKLDKKKTGKKNMVSFTQKLPFSQADYTVKVRRKKTPTYLSPKFTTLSKLE